MLERKLIGVARRLLLPAMAVSLCFSSRGCSQLCYLELVDASNPQHPTFCISSGSSCRGFPYSVGQIAIDEVSNTSRKSVWLSECVASPCTINKFSYGIDPPGWQTKRGPIPLESGKYYQMESYFFTCSGIAPSGSCSIITWQQFRQIQQDSQ